MILRSVTTYTVLLYGPSGLIFLGGRIKTSSSLKRNQTERERYGSCRNISRSARYQRECSFVAAAAVCLGVVVAADVELLLQSERRTSLRCVYSRDHLSLSSRLFLSVWGLSVQKCAKDKQKIFQNSQVFHIGERERGGLSLSLPLFPPPWRCKRLLSSTHTAARSFLLLLGFILSPLHNPRHISGCQSWLGSNRHTR